MPQSKSEHMALAEKKLQLFLDLSEEVNPLLNMTLGKLNHALRESAILMTMRNRVLLGLSLKAFASYERLSIDARDRRAEACHHLKTMVENFIYYHWVSGEAGEQRAKLVYAEGCRGMVAYYENSDEAELADRWRELLEAHINGIESAWHEFRNKGLERLAGECGLDQHYQRIYRRACEAAHVADLSTYMPPEPRGDLSLVPPDVSTLRAYVSMDYGLHLVCDLLHDASDILHIGEGEKIRELRQRMTSIKTINEITSQVFCIRTAITRLLRRWCRWYGRG